MVMLMLLPLLLGAVVFVGVIVKVVVDPVSSRNISVTYENPPAY